VGSAKAPNNSMLGGLNLCRTCFSLFLRNAAKTEFSSLTIDSTDMFNFLVQFSNTIIWWRHCLGM